MRGLGFKADAGRVDNAEENLEDHVRDARASGSKLSSQL